MKKILIFILCFCCLSVSYAGFKEDVKELTNCHHTAKACERCKQYFYIQNYCDICREEIKEFEEWKKIKKEAETKTNSNLRNKYELMAKRCAGTITKEEEIELLKSEIRSLEQEINTLKIHLNKYLNTKEGAGDSAYPHPSDMGK